MYAATSRTGYWARMCLAQPRGYLSPSHVWRGRRGLADMSTIQISARTRETPESNAAVLERMLYYLKLTREAETRIERVLYRQGRIVGGVYVGRGQEAIGVGSAI